MFGGDGYWRLEEWRAVVRLVGRGFSWSVGRRAEWFGGVVECGSVEWRCVGRSGGVVECGVER